MPGPFSAFGFVAETVEEGQFFLVTPVAGARQIAGPKRGSSGRIARKLRGSPGRWRHPDMAGLRCVIECRLRRLCCPGCGDLPEMVQWARGGARYTRDFDDLTAG
jgi:hypothetical protein